jgi:ABC-type bacteriocin/lantibiotic exporter with double-glycine peptidase domain
MVAAAGSLGLQLSFTVEDGLDLSALPLPLIAWVNRSHFVVVSRRDASGRITVLDPQAGRYEIEEAAFREFWSGEVIRITSPAPGGVGRRPARQSISNQGGSHASTKL